MHLAIALTNLNFLKLQVLQYFQKSIRRTYQFSGNRFHQGKTRFSGLNALNDDKLFKNCTICLRFEK